MSLRDIRMPRIPSSPEFAEQDMEKLMNEYSVDGLEDLLMDLKYLKDKGIYERLFDVYSNWEEPVDFFDERCQKLGSVNQLIVLANQNLSPRPPPFNLDLIQRSSFYFFYPMLEMIYSMNLRRQLDIEDLERLFNCGLGERIVFALDKFDVIDEVPEPTAEYFQNLRKVRWDNRRTKKLFKKINKIITFLIFNEYGFKGSSFKVREEMVILFLTGCSAVNDSRDRITEKDVIKAYKTYFKLMKTDITKLVDKGVKHYKPKVYEGYLVCNKCNGYYKLQPGESPDDFEECQCGGKLKYYENIDWLLEEEKKIQNEKR